MAREGPETEPAGTAGPSASIGPDDLDGATFGRARKGFAPDEVTELLRQAAEALRAALARAEDLEAQLTDARREPDRVLAEAADEAEEMVAEAQRVRDRVLADLGRRRTMLRQQIDQLRAGRERLLDAYEVVRRTSDAATDEMRTVLSEARLAAEAAGRRPEHAVEPTLDQLEEELAVARTAELPIIVDDDATDEDLHTEAAPEDAAAAPGEAPPEDAEAPPEGDVARDAAPEESPPEAAAAGREDVVEELFARLRAERADAVASAKDVLEAGAPPPAVEEVAPAEAAVPEEDPVVEEAPPAEAAAPEDSVAIASEEQVAVERAAAMAELGRTLARSMKRALADDQNTLLDSVRRWGGRSAPSADDVLPDEGAHRRPYAAAVEPDLAVSAAAGARLVGGDPGPDIAAALADDLAREVTAEIRSNLGELFGADGDDHARLTEGIGACYRTWRGTWVVEIAERRLGEAFDRGIAAGGTGAPDIG